MAMYVASLMSADDEVLECACGTGLITVPVSKRCKRIVATDFSEGMLNQAKAKCDGIKNVIFERASIMELPYKDNTFDNVIAANVIHLIDNPLCAFNEMKRVCKPGGLIIVPTYMNRQHGYTSFFIKMIESFGVRFMHQFDTESYRFFLEELGAHNAKYTLIDGLMPSCIAVVECV